jgi:hypothetical protein
MVADVPYMVIQVKVSHYEVCRQVPYGLHRDRREASLKDYLETLGLRPRHGCGTMEFLDDPDGSFRTYRQTIPCEVHGA